MTPPAARAKTAHPRNGGHLADLRPVVRIVELCAGIGQLGTGVKAGLARHGIASRVVGYCERDAAAASLLVGRMDAAEVDRAPVWDDLADFDGRDWFGRVDVVCAGLPCPAFSTAGKRGGNDDRRAWGEGFDPDDVATWGPIPHALRFIAESRPGLVFFENVPGWVNGGHFEPVGRELFGLGYTRQSAVFCSAGDVGLPHERERVFVMAYAPRCGGESWARRFGVRAAGQGVRDHLADGGRGRDEQRDDAGSVGSLQTGVEGEARERQRARDDVGDRGDDVRQAISLPPFGGLGAGGLAPGGDRQPPRGATGLADAVPPCEGGTDRPEPRNTAAVGRKRGADVGDAECIEQVGEHGDQSEAAGDDSSRAEARSDRAVGGAGATLPLHPPPRGTDLAKVAVALVEAAAADGAQHVRPDARGSASRRVAADACRLARRIWRDWAAVARLEPSLMPSTQSEVSVVAHGHPYAAADLLRVGGNSVVWQAAAEAFACLYGECVALAHPAPADAGRAPEKETA